jgi:glutathione synthase/RimK-type ligase-like ATP-grasp enzyme
VKTVVIFTRNFASDAYPFNEPYYAESYQDLLFALKAAGVQAYFASGLHTYAGAGRFTTAYTADFKRPVEQYDVAHDITADLVFEKGGFTAEDVMVINPPFVHAITSSKVETYKRFGKYQPLSVICENAEEARAAIASLPSELAVVKQPEGNKGAFVQIGSKAELAEQLPSTFPVIVQEFVDMSPGIAGLASGPHDLRVKILGGRVCGGQLRIPAPGQLRANLAQGGTSRILAVDELPPEVVRLALEIDEAFTDYPRYYALDFAHTTDGWKLIELNSKPGLPPAASGVEAKDTIEQLAQYLVEICK